MDQAGRLLGREQWSVRAIPPKPPLLLRISAPADADPDATAADTQAAVRN